MLTAQDPEFYELHERLMAAAKEAPQGRDAADRAVMARIEADKRAERRQHIAESNVVYPHAWRR